MYCNLHLITEPSFDISQTDNIIFNSRAEQKTFFDGYDTHSHYYPKFNFKDKGKTTIQVSGIYKDLKLHNYGWFEDTETYPERTYFFILDVLYINKGTTLIKITYDWFQTYQFDITWKDCYVNRRHPDSAHTMNNTLKLRYDELVFPKKLSHAGTININPNAMIIAIRYQWIKNTVVEYPIGNPNTIVGLTHPYVLLAWDLTNNNERKDLNDLLAKLYSGWYVEKGTSEDIVFMQLVNKDFIGASCWLGRGTFEPPEYIHSRGDGWTVEEGWENVWSEPLEKYAIRTYYYNKDVLGSNTFYRDIIVNPIQVLDQIRDTIVSTYTNIQVRINNSIVVNIPANEPEFLPYIDDGKCRLVLRSAVFEQDPDILIYLKDTSGNMKLIGSFKGTQSFTILNNTEQVWWQRNKDSLIFNGLTKVASGVVSGALTGGVGGAVIGAVSSTGAVVAHGIAEKQYASAQANTEDARTKFDSYAKRRNAQSFDPVRNSVTTLDGEEHAVRSDKWTGHYVGLLNNLASTEAKEEAWRQASESLRYTGSTGILDEAIPIASSLIANINMPNFVSTEGTTTSDILHLLYSEDLVLDLYLLELTSTDKDSVQKFYRMFGMSYDSLFTPTLKEYTSFCYYRMSSCNFKLQAPTDIRAYIASLFYSGIRIWRNATAFKSLNYNVSNNLS